MKHFRLITVLAGLFLFQRCSTPLDKVSLSREAYNSIEQFLAKQMQDPASLEVQFSTFLVQLDTIQNQNLFPGKREGYAVVAKYTGKTSDSGFILKEDLFYISRRGKYYAHQMLEKLSEEEKSWLWKNYDNRLPWHKSTRVIHHNKSVYTPDLPF